MAETYDLADEVLVLDNTLQKKSRRIRTIELNRRVRKAPWSTRIWTLQKGRLS